MLHYCKYIKQSRLFTFHSFTHKSVLIELKCGSHYVAVLLTRVVKIRRNSCKLVIQWFCQVLCLKSFAHWNASLKTDPNQMQNTVTDMNCVHIYIQPQQKKENPPEMNIVTYWHDCFLCIWILSARVFFSLSFSVTAPLTLHTCRSRVKTWFSLIRWRWRLSTTCKNLVLEGSSNYLTHSSYYISEKLIHGFDSLRNRGVLESSPSFLWWASDGLPAAGPSGTKLVL